MNEIKLNLVDVKLEDKDKNVVLAITENGHAARPLYHSSRHSSVIVDIHSSFRPL